MTKRASIIIHQGAQANTIKQILSAILAIRKDSVDPAVLIKALDVLDHAVQTRPVSVSNCTFTS